MEYRPTADAAPRRVAWEELEAMIRRGEIGPTAPLREPMITHGEWWTADNFRVFHRNSPVRYPLGQRLAAELKRQRREAERLERWGALLRPYHEAYDNGTLFEAVFGLAPLTALAREPGVAGASRLIELPSFEPELVVTCVFTASAVRVEVATAPTSLWHSLPQLVTRLTADGPGQEPPATPFDPRQVRKGDAALEPRRAPRPLPSWEELVAAAETAPSCSTTALDGVIYRHHVRGARSAIDVRWDNPWKDEHAAQRALLYAYAECLTAAGLARASERRR